MVINIYNPLGNRNIIAIEKLMKVVLNKIKDKIILLRDLNTHHPAWEKITTVYKPQLEYLLRKMKRRSLHLLTPYKEAI